MTTPVRKSAAPLPVPLDGSPAGLPAAPTRKRSSIAT